VTAGAFLGGRVGLVVIRALGGAVGSSRRLGGPLPGRGTYKMEGVAEAGERPRRAQTLVATPHGRLAPTIDLCGTAGSPFRYSSLV
jgi:hypothetical protein